MSEAKRFGGFSKRTEFTPIPNPFFSALLPAISDIAELKITLYVFWALYRKKDYPRYITLGELRADRPLMLGLGGGGSPEEALGRGLDMAIDRGTLLRLNCQRDGEAEQLYFINDEQSRRALVRIESGELEVGDLVLPEPASTEAIPNIFALYEQYIGLYTPIIADELKEAQDLYPASWIEEAFREAVVLNKRSWRYINRILEGWASEGKSDGRTGKSAQKDISPEEYIRKYSNFTRKR